MITKKQQQTRQLVAAIAAKYGVEIANQVILFGESLVSAGVLSQAEIYRRVNDFASSVDKRLATGAGLSAVQAETFLKSKSAEYLAKLAMEVSGDIPDTVRELFDIRLGGGLQDIVLDAVWNKVWQDGKILQDRIYLIGMSVSEKVQQILKQGIADGSSAAQLGKLTYKLLGQERAAATRLAAHTINTAYHEASSQLTMNMSFIKGLKITRAPPGEASDNCDICYEHAGEPGGDGKEYYKEEFGGRDIDMWALANAPPYHPHCKCDADYIEMSPTEFIKYAMQDDESGPSDDGKSTQKNTA